MAGRLPQAVLKYLRASEWLGLGAAAESAAVVLRSRQWAQRLESGGETRVSVNAERPKHVALHVSIAIISPRLRRSQVRWASRPPLPPTSHTPGHSWWAW